MCFGASIWKCFSLQTLTQFLCAFLNIILVSCPLTGEWFLEINFHFSMLNSFQKEDTGVAELQHGGAIYLIGVVFFKLDGRLPLVNNSNLINKNIFTIFFIYVFLIFRLMLFGICTSSWLPWSTTLPWLTTWWGLNRWPLYPIRIWTPPISTAFSQNIQGH